MTRSLRHLVLALPAVLFVACGARTGLIVPEIEVVDADADVRETLDVHDVPDLMDVAEDGPSLDVLPPIDVAPICTDATVQYIYVVTTKNEILSFYPPTLGFENKGILSCPASGGATPFSMAVDRKGVAYVLYNDGELFEVALKDLSCKKSPFKSATSTFNNFGMGFAAESDGSETLYIAAADDPSTLAKFALPSYALTGIGTLVGISRPELTGTGAGQLFGFWANPEGGSGVGAFDKKTAKVLERVDLPSVEQGMGWAFAFWGGDFYLFTAPGGSSSEVTRYRPSDRSVTRVSTWPSVIVGAGVSTCAPG